MNVTVFWDITLCDPLEIH